MREDTDVILAPHSLKAGPNSSPRQPSGSTLQIGMTFCHPTTAASTTRAHDTVRQLVAGNGFLFSDCGDAALRGFEDSVRLYEVRWQVEK